MPDHLSKALIECGVETRVVAPFDVLVAALDRLLLCAGGLNEADICKDFVIMVGLLSFLILRVQCRARKHPGGDIGQRDRADEGKAQHGKGIADIVRHNGRQRNDRDKRLQQRNDRVEGL